MPKTLFMDIQAKSAEVVRVQTESSVYFVAFHDERGRRYVVVRGMEGSDRENVVVRDSDPRIGDRSMFDVPIEQWVGQVMEVATMRTSPIVSAMKESSQGGQPTEVGAPARVPIVPRGHAPAIMPGFPRGTSVGTSQPVPERDLARQVVVSADPVPYPQRHVGYAEDVAALLRSIHRRDRLFEDIATDAELTRRMHRALDDAEDLLRMIQRRAKTRP